MPTETTNTKYPWKEYVKHFNAKNEELFFFSDTTNVGPQRYFVHQAVQHLFSDTGERRQRIASIRLENRGLLPSSRMPKTLSLSIARLEGEREHLRFMVHKTVSSIFFTNERLREKLFSALAEQIQKHLAGTEDEIADLLEKEVEYCKKSERIQS